MGCICSFLKALTSYHGAHLTPEQIARQRQARAQRQRAAQEPTDSSSSSSTPSWTFGPRTRTSEPTSEQSTARLGQQGRSDSAGSLMRTRFPSEDQSSKSPSSSPQKFPTFVHRSPQIHHQRSLQGPCPSTPNTASSSSPASNRQANCANSSKHVTFDIRTTKD